MPEINTDLKSFEMEVANIFSLEQYELSDAEKEPIIKKLSGKGSPSIYTNANSNRAGNRQTVKGLFEKIGDIFRPQCNETVISAILQISKSV